MTQLRGLLVYLFGNIRWTPPGWGRAMVRRWRISLPIVLLLALAGWGIHRGSVWWKNRPKPAVVAVEVKGPVEQPGNSGLKRPLYVHFAKSVAPLDQMGLRDQTNRKSVRDVRIDPAMAGRWTWMGDTTLRFDPEENWPAATTYTITLGPDALAPDTLLASRTLSWTSQPFESRIRGLQFYQDPRDPTLKQVVATVDFTHAVDLASLKKAAAFVMVGREGETEFQCEADKGRYTVYLRTVPLVLPDRDDFMKLVLAKGIRTTRGPATTGAALEEKVRIPGSFSFFQIKECASTVVTNKDGDPEQILAIETTALVDSAVVAKALTATLLPKKADGAKWESEGDVDDSVLAQGEPVQLETMPTPGELSQSHTFRFRRQQAGEMLVRIDDSLQAPGGYMLRERYRNVVPVPMPRPQVQVASEGGVLALTGERKVSVRSRGLVELEYEIARVSTAQINHLVSQTEGNFQSPEFLTGVFDEENISRIGRERQTLAGSDLFAPAYSVFDFAPHLAVPQDGGSERGLFFLTIRGWDPAAKAPIDGVADRRFILVTDLGLIVKENADGGRDVFVASIHDGRAIPQVRIDILGKNGVPLASGFTDEEGRAAMPVLKDLEREKKPVAVVARFGEDVAFLPYDREDRRLDFSRFDIGGLEGVSSEDLEAFVFTERGIYRPGDSIHSGYIIRRRDWQGEITGLPIEVQVTDPRGRVVYTSRASVPEGGFGEFTCPTAASTNSGVYTIDLFLIRNGERTGLLGSAEAWVKEFQPDRMKIDLALSCGDVPGWIRPASIQAGITLRNLYGTPATDRRVKGRLVLSPVGYGFAGYEDYSFYDRLRDGKRYPSSATIELDDQKTDASGAASFDLPLERFTEATYQATFYAEGFEAGDGRSVATQRSVLVSPLDYVLGTKPDGDFSYITKGTPRSVHVIAVNEALQKMPVAGLSFRLLQKTHVSVLTRQSSGSYAYESAMREVNLDTQARDIPAEGLDFALNTATPGDYRLEVFEPSGHRVGQVSYTVVGVGATGRSLEKDAELDLTLPRREYRAGEEIEVAIAAPFTGSGLITLERDRVYAHAWFQSSTTSSVQRIRIPEGFEGSGYVNVTFIRSLDSREVFMSPLSYAIEPVTVGRASRQLPVHLEVPEKAKPGEPLRIGYRTNRPARIAIFAVDEGILQVSDYQLPRPVDHFFRKVAHGVGTSQILDLIMPEYSILRSVSASGGDGEMLRKGLNPFQRVTEKPVVYWSGIIEATPERREVTYDVPDYFDGTLRVMAVAFSGDAAGGAEEKSLVRSRFVITPGLPTVAAPGDTFEVGVTVNNGGPEAEVRLEATASEHLAVIKAPDAPVRIGSGAETTLVFTVKATDVLGSGALRFRASGDGEESVRTATASVRPPVPFLTQVRSERFTRGSQEIRLERSMYAEYRRVEATVSALPLGLAGGLDHYLKTYPYGCSEQITSGSFCRLMLAGEADFGLTRREIAAQLEETFSVLRRRQTDQGGFSYWPGSAADDFVTVYVTHFLVEAKDAGFAPPPALLAGALRRLEKIAGEVSVSSLERTRLQAYAIYVLTRESVITTNFIVNLRDTLDHQSSPWKSDLTAVYLGGALALLHKDQEGAALVQGYRIGRSGTTWAGLYSPLAADSQYVAILARHFPTLLRKLTAEEFLHVLKLIEQGRFNTLSAAYAVVALKSYSQMMEKIDPGLALEEQSSDRKWRALPSSGGLTRKAEISPEAINVRLSGKAKPFGVFGQVVEMGFDRTPATVPIREGLEVYREYPKSARVGDPIEVVLKVRSLKGELENVAVVDLLPGGFELAGSVMEPVASGDWDHVEVREDRTVFFGTLGPRVRTIRYMIKPTNRGEFTVPPAFAESMYDPGVHGRGVSQTIRVEDAR